MIKFRHGKYLVYVADNGEPSSLRSQDRFSRRCLLKYAVAGVAVLSQVPPVSALDTIQIPKLSYNPTVDQLISDFDLQKQMVAVDEKVVNAPVTAKVGIGFDDNNMNFVNAHIARTTRPNDEVMVIAVDKTFKRMAFYTSDVFMCKYVHYFSDPTGASSGANYRIGSYLQINSRDLPAGFTWKAAFTRSYFNQDKEHPVIVAQIPFSHMGPGGQDGKYGIFTTILSNLSGGLDWNGRDYSSYPAGSDNSQPNAFGSFTTQYPIPEFPKSLSLLTLPLALALGLTSIRKNRMNRRHR